MIPLLTTLLACLNSWVKGSFKNKENINTIFSVTPELYEYLSKLMLRVIDNIDSEFYNLKKHVVLFIIHLSESGTEKQKLIFAEH